MKSDDITWDYTKCIYWNNDLNKTEKDCAFYKKGTIEKCGIFCRYSAGDFCHNLEKYNKEKLK